MLSGVVVGGEVVSVGAGGGSAVSVGNGGVVAVEGGGLVTVGRGGCVAVDGGSGVFVKGGGDVSVEAGASGTVVACKVVVDWVVGVARRTARLSPGLSQADKSMSAITTAMCRTEIIAMEVLCSLPIILIAPLSVFVVLFSLLL
jgi:hypothetical protein